MRRANHLPHESDLQPASNESVRQQPKASEGKKPRPAPWGELAQRLRVSRGAIANWKKLPGCPQTPDYAAWEAFVKANELGVVGNRTSAEREDLLKKKLRSDIRLNEIKIAKEERSVVDRAAVDQMLLRMGSLQKARLYQKLENEMPAKAVAFGAQVEPMKRLGREIADALCEIFSQEMDQWTEQR
jgi:hypothetical protein